MICGFMSSPSQGDQPAYFAAWKDKKAVWTDFEGRRQFWLHDEAESVIRHLGIGKIIIENKGQ